MITEDVTVLARDGARLTATCFGDRGASRWVLISSATAVSRRYYARFARDLAERGYAVVTYDYRGVGDSRPASLRGYQATFSQWGLVDLPSMIEWIVGGGQGRRVFLVGHSAGGQLAGLIDNPDAVEAMVAVCSQSGYWRVQGGSQRALVALHAYVTLPVVASVLGYFPWSRLARGEDIPKGVALEWSRWCRDPRYLLGDASLPLHRYASFRAPVLAYSVDDDNWGTARSVDAMMSAYPNVERRHIKPKDLGLRSLGHFGAFRERARPLWDQISAWLGER